jgi:hypothetical protein
VITISGIGDHNPGPGDHHQRNTHPMMPSRVLWAIDNEMDPRTFERMCADILFRDGHRDIVPVQAQDGGRDAEDDPRPGRGRAGEAAYYQFSSEEDWKAKLRQDAAKLKRGGHDFSTFVFVSTRTTGIVPPPVEFD